MLAVPITMAHAGPLATGDFARTALRDLAPDQLYLAAQGYARGAASRGHWTMVEVCGPGGTVGWWSPIMGGVFLSAGGGHG